MKYPMKTISVENIKGFSMLELLVVLAIVAILAMMAMPSLMSSSAKDQVKESLLLVEGLKKSVEAFHLLAQAMPANNEEAGIPPANKLLGNYVTSIELKDGAFNIVFGNKAVQSLQGLIVTVRAISVLGSPASPISWVCGYSIIPNGMEAVGENRSNVPAALLPVSCRATGTMSSH